MINDKFIIKILRGLFVLYFSALGFVHLINAANLGISILLHFQLKRIVIARRHDEANSLFQQAANYCRTPS